MEPRVLQYRLEKYTQACGLEGVHFHTLRHTFATRAVEVGFEIKSLSEILGHASVTITLDRYVHSSLELKRDNMQLLHGSLQIMVLKSCFFSDFLHFSVAIRTLLW